MAPFPVIDPAEYTLTLHQGVTFEKQFTWTDEDSVEYDLDGCIVRAQIRSFHEDETVIHEFSTEHATPNVVVAGGTFTLHATAEEVSAITADPKYVWDLEIEDPADGVVVRLLEGTCVVTPEVTR